MKFTKQDLQPSRNMLKALGKGKWELDGMEIMAFAQMMQWFAGVQKSIESELELEEIKIRSEEEAKKPADVLAPKEVMDPIKNKPLKAPKNKE